MKQSMIHLGADAFDGASAADLPLTLTTESTAIIGIRRSGKSHAAKRVVEELHASKQQVVIIDPKGDWWGLRSAADGKAPGIPIVIAGGEHGDVPIEPDKGEQFARLVVEQTVSLLLDLSQFRKGELHRFATDFLETLYRLKAQERYRTAMALVVDEADLIAPQQPRAQGQKGGYVERMLGAIDDCVRRGGQRGIGVVLVTQRPAVLNKNVLSQAGILLLFRVTGKQDIDAIQDWIELHAQQEQADKVMESIAGQPRGECWVWAPGWPTHLGYYRRIRVGENWTFDSGRTPEIGQRRAEPKMLADVDLAAFQREMAETIARKQADDPKILRDRIRALEKVIAEAQGQKPALTPAKIEKVPVLREQDLVRLEKAVERIVAAVDRRSAKLLELLAPLASENRLEDLRDAVKQILDPIRARVDKAQDPTLIVGGDQIRIHGARPGEMIDIRAVRGNPEPRPSEAHRAFVAAPEKRDGVLPTMQRTFLVHLADRGAPLKRTALLTLAGYRNGGATSRAFASLLADGYVQGEDGTLAITALGIKALGDYQPLPTGSDLRKYLLDAQRSPLASMERRILEYVAHGHGANIRRTMVLEALGYKNGGATSRAFSALINRGYLKKEGSGQVSASPLLFD